MAVYGLNIKMALGHVIKLKTLLKPKVLAPMQAAFISGKALRDNTIVKPAPFPYKEKTLGFFRAYLDMTSKRFDENTKIVIVDGNIAVGKTTLAKELADELDMMYMPEATIDSAYINAYGYDIRDYNHLIPETTRPFDLADFYKNPKHQSTANFQLIMYRLRFEQYLDTIIHILNTGQGVVMDRCVYSDFCFLEAMFRFGYISPAARAYYYEVKANTICELMRPHLVIYLDAPINVLMDRIKKRGHDYEVSSKVLSPEYLEALADVYKNKYLKEMEQHAELLIYDWSDFGDVEVVVEDIERIDFDRFERQDSKLKDWRITEEREWRGKRFNYTRDKDYIMRSFNVPNFDVPELEYSSDDAQKYWDAFDMVPGNRYEPGYNKDVGDSGILFKVRRLRRF